MNQIPDTIKLRHALFLAPLLALPLVAQTTQPGDEDAPANEDVVVLSPFEVSSEAETGYAAAATLAGNRLNTELRDIGSSISIITSEFLRDTGAVNNETLLQYTTGTEVGNIYGNFAGLGDGTTPDETGRFANPNGNTRVRGLTAADNSRDYFIVSMPWDGYNVDAVDLQRGPNSILFGLGSPAGLLNVRTKQAAFQTKGEVEIRFASFGTTRASLDYNHEIIEDELAVRVAALHEHEKFQQDPAFEKDRRLYAALRYEPGFLSRGSARTSIRANFETGEIDSNRPRALPPFDFITPYFQSGDYQGGYQYDAATEQWNPTRTYSHLNKGTFNPFQVQDDNTGRPNHGQQRPSINGGPNAGQPNPYYQPWLGNFGQNFNGPLAYYDANSSSPMMYLTPEARTIRGIGANGAVDGSLGLPYHRQVSIAPYYTWARQSGQPFSDFGLYRNRSLTDPSIFNFYDNLLDGPNKKEWQNFEVLSVSLDQTFMDNKFGFQASYNTETYDNGQLTMLSGDRYAIFIDPMASFAANATPAGSNGEPFADGTPNPNVGRPFITDSWQFGNNTYDSERESGRVTAFFTHDFMEADRDSWWRTILGKHTFTGLIGQDRHTQDNRSFQRYAILDQNYFNFLGVPTSTKFTANELAVNPVVYIGPSLLGASSASGANLQAPTAFQVSTGGTTLAFDSTWNAPNVNPADLWWNDYYPDTPENNRPDDPTTPANDPGSRRSTQSENPANYVGWREVPFQVTDSEAAPGNRNLLTTDARLNRTRVSSRAFVWQAQMLNEAIVGTFGYREDTVKVGRFSRNVNGSDAPLGILDLGPTYTLPELTTLADDEISRSHSVVAHLNELPFLDRLMESFPIDVSLLYNESENFQVEANRVNLYGEQIPLPSGSTREKGILLETKDGKYSLRIQQYETKVQNATSSALGGAWFIGSSQAWAANWANIFEFDIRNGDTLAGVDPNPDPTYTRYNYGTAPGEELPDAQAREAAAIAAWRAWQAQVDPRFYAAWGIDLNDTSKSVTASTPNGFAVTEDTISKGYEFELNASPTRNWRVSLNAARTKAERNNIGGTELRQFVADYENALRNTAAGDLRIWWGGAGNETTLYQWRANIGSEYAQRKLQEGTKVPELREWRVNAITNYTFSEGRFKGFGVGGAVRWEDDVIIGYSPFIRDDGEISFDLENPYRGPTETHFDFWVSYDRKLTDKIDWSIQLNVRNAFEGDDLIPVTTQPDGTVATYRIAPAQVWSITNRFRF